MLDRLRTSFLTRQPSSRLLRRKSREYTNGTEIAGGREKIV